MLLKNALKRISNKLFKKHGQRDWNVVIDQFASPPDFESIAVANKSKLDIPSEKVTEWLKTGGLTQFINNSGFEKKGLEFFFSAHALAVGNDEIVLDAAGGRSSYLDALKANGHRGKRYLNDHIYTGTHERPDGVHVVGGDATEMHLDDASVNKIACHHAFEHFHSDKDSRFISEAFRVLAPGGALVITPLFLADKYVELWNTQTDLKYDDAAVSLVDQTASLPGQKNEGNFARIYDLESLQRRVIGPADELGFRTEIIECEIDGTEIPDMKLCFGSALNRPLRLLIFRK